MGKLIGIFATDIASRVQGKIYHKLHERLKSEGYTLVFFSAELCRTDFQSTDISAFRLLEIAERMEFSAFFLHVESLQNKDLIEKIIEMGSKRDIPVFLYDCDNFGYAHDNRIITINPDYKQGFSACVNHIIEHHGCKNIYMLAGTKGNKYSEERIEAYKSTMKAHGLEVSEEKIAYGGFWEVPAIEAVNSLMDRIESENLPVPEAICCANDSMAIATVKELVKRGYSVPDDILITGFDGIEDGKFSSPAVSTCEPVLDEVPEYILDVINKGIRSDEFLVPLAFIPKESCGCENSFKAGDAQEMAKIMVNVRQNTWQYSMLSNLQLGLINSCDINSLFGGMHNTVLNFKGMGLLYCIRNDLEVQDDFTSDFDELRVRLNFDFYDGDDYQPFAKEVIIPDFKETVLEAEKDELFVFQILHSADDRFGYSVIKAKTFETNGMRIFSQFAESFTNMLESVLRNIRLEQATEKLNEMYEKMSEMYIRDVMTGLYNRTGYYKELDEFLKREELKNGYIHVYSVDMDGLKQINDNFGHQEGDIAIMAMAKAISNCFSKPCICARFGGDEFEVVLFTEREKEPDLECISARINDYLKRLPELKDKPYSVGVSIGHSVSLISEIGEIKNLEKLADDNMYINKRERKGTRI